VQLSGELSKVNLGNLLQLVKTGGLTGKITFSQGAKLATVYILDGIPVHAETEGEDGVEGLMELFLWTSGAFSFNEESVDGVPLTIDDEDSDQSFERLLKDGLSYQEAKQYLDAYDISPRSILKPTGNAVSFAKQILAMPGLERLDGRSTLAEVLSDLHLSKREYVRTVSSWMMDGLASRAEPVLLEDMDRVDLPAWVMSRLKQDNPDISQAIVDMVIWVDRVKCWMFQVDVDFYKIRKQIEQSTGGSGDFDEDSGEHEQIGADIFNPPAAPPESALGIYAPTYDSPNYWRGSNYYQGGSLFRPTVLDNLDDAESGQPAPDQSDTTSSDQGNSTNKPPQPNDRKPNQKSLEF
jgi:hypothetical protein